jgi:uncharacterized membrane protein
MRAACCGYGAAMRDRWALIVLALVAASALCVATLELRIHRTGDPYYRFLVWNLFLAWLPLAFTIAAFARARRRVDFLVVVLLLLWLLFFPNAPYVLTDFIHLGTEHRQFDALLLASFAFTALALGFASLLLVQLVVTRAAGAAIGWFVALSSLLAASVGIYLGRVLRLNSWDVVQRPGHLAEIVRGRLEDPFGNRHLIGYVVILCVFQTLAYCALYGFTALAASARRDRP